MFTSLVPLLVSAFKKIYTDRKAPLIDEALVFNLRTFFTDGIAKGWGKIKDIDGDTVALRALQKNVTIFTLFKNHQNMKDVASLLTKNGKLQSYEDFEKDALKVSLNYNKHWLKTEYNTVVRQSKLVQQWEELSNDDSIQYLEYVTKDDDAVRDEHAKWDGAILPKDHSWWNTHYPTNGFNCRCSVKAHKELPDGKELTKKPDYETYHKEFNFNAGMTHQIFGDNHQYFKNIPDETVEELKEYSEHLSLTQSRW